MELIRSVDLMTNIDQGFIISLKGLINHSDQLLGDDLRSMCWEEVDDVRLVPGSSLPSVFL